MQVECTRNSRDERSYQLTVGNTYMVIEIAIETSATDREQILLYRLYADDEEMPGLYEADLFTIASPKLPSGWVMSQFGPTFFTLGPERWSYAGFWEDYFDNEQQARRSFQEEIARMNAELSSE